MTDLLPELATIACALSLPLECGLVTLKGRLDGPAVPALESAVESHRRAGVRHILLDCETLSYVSNAGLRSLFALARQMQAEQGRLAVCAPLPQVADMLHRSGFAAIVPVTAMRLEAEAVLTGITFASPVAGAA